MKANETRTFQSAPARRRIAEVLALLDGRLATAAEVAQGVHTDAKTARAYLHHLHDLGEIHIAAYDDDHNRTALYTKGRGADAVRMLVKNAPPAPRRERSDQEDDDDLRRALDVQRRKMALWRPRRDPLIAAFFGGATA